MLSHGYPPTLSGVSLVVQKLSRAMIREGHQVLVVTASETMKPYTREDEGVQLQRLRAIKNPFWSEGPVSVASSRTLERLIHNFQPDVIHTHDNALLSFQLLRLKRISGVPYISSAYYLPRFATQYLRWGALPEKMIEAGLWKYGVFNLNRYDFVIFSTRTQQQEFIRHGLRVPSLAISNGVDTRRYHPANRKVEDVEQTYALPPGPRVLFVGRLMKDKRIDLLIRAMA